MCKYRRFNEARPKQYGQTHVDGDPTEERQALQVNEMSEIYKKRLKVLNAKVIAVDGDYLTLLVTRLNGKKEEHTAFCVNEVRLHDKLDVIISGSPEKEIVRVLGRTKRKK